MLPSAVTCSFDSWLKPVLAGSITSVTLDCHQYFALQFLNFIELFLVPNQTTRSVQQLQSVVLYLFVIFNPNCYTLLFCFFQVPVLILISSVVFRITFFNCLRIPPHQTVTQCYYGLLLPWTASVLWLAEIEAEKYITNQIMLINVNRFI